MAADDANSRLYWNNGASLFSATYASLLSGTPSISTVAMTFNAATVNFVGLGFNPTTGKLLGVRNITTESVYEIDPVTGVANIIYGHPTAFDFGGLEYDSTNGKLYGLNDATGAGSGSGLYELVDTNTQTFIAPYPAGETDIDGLAVHNGLAYYVTDGPNTVQASFYVYSIATGTQVGTLASPFTGSGTFSAATYAAGLGPVPEPASMLALAGGVALLIRRRRRG